MSKILNIRNSIKKIKIHLQSHDVSCMFFNNDCSLFTTLEQNVGEPNNYFITHQELFKKIQSIRCSSITDFNKIAQCLEKLENIKSYDSSNTISIIVSDGHHTIDTEKNVEEIKDLLYDKFDYSIGIGTEFDSNLLSTVAKNFLGKNDNNLFNFLFHSLDNIKVEIPKNTFFVSSSKFTEQMSSPDQISMAQSVETSLTCSKHSYTNLIFDSNHERKHYLFIIDISGSMDDSIYSCLISSNRDENSFFYNKFTEDKVLLMESDEVDLYLSNDSNDANEDFEIYKKYNYSYNNIDEIFITCKTFFYLNPSSTQEKLEQLYLLNHNLYRDENLKNFVRSNYNSLLSYSERKMNNLLHERISHPIMDNRCVQINDIDFENRCSICLQNTKNILFSCHHVTCCFECVLKLLEPLEYPSCPICRERIMWLRHCIPYDSNNLSCKSCEINMGDLYQDGCNHILFCSQCCDINEYKLCNLCNRKINLITKVHFS